MNPSRATACDLVYIAKRNPDAVAVAKLRGEIRGDSRGDRLEIVGDLIVGQGDSEKVVSRNNLSMNLISYLEESEFFA